MERWVEDENVRLTAAREGESPKPLTDERNAAVDKRANFIVVIKI